MKKLQLIAMRKHSLTFFVNLPGKRGERVRLLLVSSKPPRRLKSTVNSECRQNTLRGLAYKLYLLGNTFASTRFTFGQLFRKGRLPNVTNISISCPRS